MHSPLDSDSSIPQKFDFATKWGILTYLTLFPASVKVEIAVAGYANAYEFQPLQVLF